MKLAEALAERSDCQKRIEELRKRILLVAKVQEGELPAEEPDDLLAELDRLFTRLLELIQRINQTNAATRVTATQMISDAIAERELLGKRRDVLRSISEAASVRQDRYSKSEVRFIATVPIASLQRQADDLAKRFRELDTRLQELNWRTDLI